MPRPSRHRWNRFLALVLALAAMTLTGCASFPDTGPREWRELPEGAGPLAPPPRVPPTDPTDPNQPAPPAPPGEPAPAVGCVDPDPQVVATCLDPVSAVAVLPGGQSALVAERATGRVLRVEKDKEPVEVTTVPVDAAGGGLIGLVLSPSYAEDGLLYAYAASPTDYRVLRLAPGDPAEPILSGIPRVGTPGGALAVGKDGSLLVATASDGSGSGPASLAGKILKIDALGRPASGNPDPSSPVYSQGLRSPAGMCTAPDTGTVWVTDRLPDQDVLQQVEPGELGTPEWTWPERPGVAGCAAPPGAVVVAQADGAALFGLRTAAPGAFTGTPETLLADTYGRLDAVALAPDGLIWLGTTNKRSGGPVAASDDRVIRIQPPSGGGSGPE